MMRQYFYNTYETKLQSLIGKDQAKIVLYYTNFPQIGYKTPFALFLEDPQVFEDFFIELANNLVGSDNKVKTK